MLHSPCSQKPLIRQWCSCNSEELTWLQRAICQGRRWNRNCPCTQPSAIQACLPQDTLLTCPKWSKQLLLMVQPRFYPCTAALVLDDAAVVEPSLWVRAAVPLKGHCFQRWGLGKSHVVEDLVFLNHRADLKPHPRRSSPERGSKVCWLSGICVSPDAGSPRYLHRHCKRIA